VLQASSSQPSSQIPDQAKERYKALWRWHFYAGLYVIPILLMLSLTGLVMMWYQPVIEPLLYPGQTKVEPIGFTQPFDLQQVAVEQAYPDAKVTQMITPKSAFEPTRFLMQDGSGTNWLTSVDPYSLTVLGRHNKDDTWYAIADNIHGTFLLGSFGDAMIEIAAGLMLILLLTGLMIWWQKPGRVGRWRLDFSLNGRSFWKELHSKIGAYGSIILLLFVISGLSWTGVWGAKMVQAWSSFPDGVYSNIPTSDLTHADLNPGVHEEVPWNLEQTHLPESGSTLGQAAIQGPVSLDSVVKHARSMGMTQFRVNLPKSDEGVYSVMAATMSRDITNAFKDRTLHFDQYTGNLLADIQFNDYSPFAKAMALGIPLHMGTWTTLNFAFNTLFCLAMILICCSGIIMWWKRRPAKTGIKVSAPPAPKYLQHWQSAFLIWLGASLFVPLLGITLFVLFLLDHFLVKSITRRLRSSDTAARLA
jgi:uncharacterized iron-regulated membrane protein